MRRLGKHLAKYSKQRERLQKKSSKTGACLSGFGKSKEVSVEEQRRRKSSRR